MLPKRPRKRAFCVLGVLGLLGILLGVPLGLHAGGPFKVRTQDFEWQILKGEQIDLYHYPQEKNLAAKALNLAEKALQHDADVLDYHPTARQPLFLFQSHLDFQQTNISPEVIGPGTGGFTEAYKNRVVLPTNQSQRWLNIVITHELAHAIQFNVLYGEGSRSFQVLKNYVIPLWVMEGMAEYCAQNWDSFADMVLRDAVLNDRVPDLDLLDGFSHLSEVYIAYKASQSAIQHLALNYGVPSVAALLKKYKAQISTDQILKDLTGKGLHAFSNEWKTGLRKRYWSALGDRQGVESLGRKLAWHNSEDPASDNGVAWAPDSRRLAFVTTRRQREEIWVLDVTSGEAKALFVGPFEEIGRSGAYGVSGRRLSWSPSGKQLAFVRVHDGIKHLCLADLDGDIQDLDLPMKELAAPAWSPDGKSLAFSASQDGVSQIYVLELASGQFRAITQEKEQSLVTDPAWSPDGKALVYSAEEGDKNQVFWQSLASGPPQRLSLPGHDCLMPAFSHQGERVYFITDEAGGYDLAWAPVRGGPTTRLTHVISGVFAPAPSPDGRYLALTAYEDGCQNLLLLAAPDYAPPVLSEGMLDLIDPYRSLHRPARPQAALPQAMALSDAASDSADRLTHTTLVTTEPYHLSITPDLFFMIFGYDNLSGLVGGGYVSASDMTGSHNFSLMANLMPGYETVVRGGYVLYQGRWDLGLNAYYRNSNYLLPSLNPQTIDTTFVDQDWGAGLTARRPLNGYTRLEASLGARRLYRSVNGTAAIDPELTSTLGENYINPLGLGLIRDTTTYKNFDVYGGYHLSLSASYADRTLASTRNYVTYQAEGRWNLPLSFLDPDLVFSARILSLEQSGSDRQAFYVGGAQVRGLSYNEYLGQRLALGNVQLRAPYLRHLNGHLWPLTALMLKDVQWVAFYDAGLAPSNWEKVETTDLRGGYGIGFRLHSFLFQKAFALFAFDIAQRTDKPGSTYYYFTLGQIF